MEVVSGIVSLILSKCNFVVCHVVLAVSPLGWKVERLNIQGCGQANRRGEAKLKLRRKKVSNVFLIPGHG
jgi:hypothetical protein